MSGLPLGVFTRPRSDFNREFAAIAHGDSPAVTNAAVALYNNDDQARVFHVFGLAWATSTIQQIPTYLMYQGHMSGAATPARARRVGDPQPPGEVYAGTALGNPGNAGRLVFGPFLPGGAIFAGSGLFFVPPGWSLQVNAFSAVVLCGVFYYTYDRPPAE